ncbi:MAG: TorF family putative porin [Bdellovibrionales bacterium]
MKGIVIAFGLILASAPAAAEISSSITWANVFIWRGQTFSPDGGNSIGGNMVYNHESGLQLGVYANNLQAPFYYEFNHWLAYVFKQDDYSITGTIYRYYLPRNMQYSTMGYRITGQVADVTASVEYMPEYFWGPGYSGHADTSSNIYARAEYAWKFSENDSLVPQVGYSWFDDGELVGHKSYLDYSLSIRHRKDQFVAEVGWVGTDRKEYVAGPSTTGGATKDTLDDRPYFKVTYNF